MEWEIRKERKMRLWTFRVNLRRLIERLVLIGKIVPMVQLNKTSERCFKCLNGDNLHMNKILSFQHGLVGEGLFKGLG